MQTRNHFPLFIKALLMLFAFNFCIANDTEASHFRYGNITWKRVPGTDSIEFKITQAYRRSYPGWIAPSVGSVVTTGDVFYPGYGSGVNIQLTVTSVNIAEDWFYGEFTYRRLFPNTPATYTASSTNCCRISTLSNNNDVPYLVSSIVTIGNNNDAPVSTVPPYVNFGTNNAMATYQLPAVDPNGDSLTFSLTPNGTFGTTTIQPPGISVSPTGLLTFNTVGKAVGSLWNTNVTVTDSKGATIQLDLILRITVQSTPPYFDYTVTPANSTTYVVAPGGNVNFNLKALDNDFGDVVAITAVGLPIGSSFVPGAGNPANTSFSWTPTFAQVGTYVVNFTAEDNNGSQASTVVNIVVSAAPSFNTPPTPGTNSTFCVQPGSNVSHTYMATDPDSTDVVTLSATSGVAAGMSFSPALPVTDTGAASTLFSWTPAATDWGLHTLVIRATDKYNDYSENTAFFIVNNAPTFTSLPITSVNVGQFYSYTVTTDDLNTAQGDEVGVESTSLPPFLTIVDNGDGTMTISGTPTMADVGTHNVMIEIEDEMNHVNGTHCGNNVQTYTLTVVPCNLSISHTVTNVACHGDATGAVDIHLQNATAPINYTWSNGATTEDIMNVAAGTYTVAIQDANGCTIGDTATVNEPATAVSSSVSVNPSPTIPGHAPNTIYIGYGAQSLTLNGSANGGTPGYSYNWSPATGLSSTNTASTNASPTSTTVYTLTVTDANGCVSTSSVTINVVNAVCSNGNGNSNNNGIGNGNTTPSGNYKVMVCHKTGKSWNQLCVSVNAVASHLAHGDMVGPCPSNMKLAMENGEEETEMKDVIVYPNPTTGMVNVMLPHGVENAQIIIADVTGKVVVNTTANQEKKELNLSSLSKGVYLIQVKNNELQYRSKLVIE